METFGGELKKLREEREVSLEILAQRAGTSPAHCREVEEGRVIPTPMEAFLLLRALGFPPSEVLEILGSRRHEEP
ncbi:transcriptional regulator with XRE-family HTH domain [Haloferula luteola]|uniref:Transcriptional regulator with XRE-family HTH domain n=1 Tax=Haloferula luteola TaxID=595692 RepID=A0A840V020_9BACT|nr:transcriptional regulator with XRE-family HTH domain [Haloferula luteola]